MHAGGMGQSGIVGNDILTSGIMYKIYKTVISTYFNKNTFNISNFSNVLDKSNNPLYEKITLYAEKSYNRRNKNYNNLKEHDVPRKYFLYASGGFLINFFQSKDKEEDDETSIIMTIKRSILLIQKTEHKKAEQMLHLALRQAQSIKNKNAVTYIYDVMANLAFDLKQYDKAETLFVSVMQMLMSAGVQEDDPRIIHISLKLAKLFEEKQDFSKAENGYKFCLDQLESHVDKEILPLKAMTLDWYAHMLSSQSRYSESYKYLTEAYDIGIEINGFDHEQTVILLNDLGIVSHAMGDVDLAMKHLQKAVSIGKNLPDMTDLGSIYINLGNLYLIKDLYKEAEKHCSNGLELSQSNDEKYKAKECLKKIENLVKMNKY